jgi:hypothetical protein
MLPPCPKLHAKRSKKDRTSMSRMEAAVAVPVLSLFFLRVAELSVPMIAKEDADQTTEGKEDCAQCT